VIINGLAGRHCSRVAGRLSHKLNGNFGWQFFGELVCRSEPAACGFRFSRGRHDKFFSCGHGMDLLLLRHILTGFERGACGNLDVLTSRICRKLGILCGGFVFSNLLGGGLWCLGANGDFRRVLFSGVEPVTV
jgi:hypothetical protein